MFVIGHTQDPAAVHAAQTTTAGHAPAQTTGTVTTSIQAVTPAIVVPTTDLALRGEGSRNDLASFPAAGKIYF